MPGAQGVCSATSLKICPYQHSMAAIRAPPDGTVAYWLSNHSGTSDSSDSRRTGQKNNQSALSGTERRHDLRVRYGKRRSRPISRVLSRAAIPLGCASPRTSSSLPGSGADHTSQVSLRAPLFGLAPGGVFRAAAGYPPRGALLPHLFTLAGACALRRYVFCGTVRGLTPPRRYLAPCPAEPGLSSALARCDCLADSEVIITEGCLKPRKRAVTSFPSVPARAHITGSSSHR